MIITIRDAAVAVLNEPTLSKRLNDLDFVPIGDKPDEFTARVGTAGLKS